jgi:hypothetical protein
VTHIIGAVVAYSFYKNKPCVFNPEQAKNL